LQRFYNGSFRFSYNSNLLRFESVLGSYANQWGGLIHFSREDEGELIVSLSRTGESDLVPGGVSSLIDLRFTALSSGTAKLAVEPSSTPSSSTRRRLLSDNFRLAHDSDTFSTSTSSDSFANQVYYHGPGLYAPGSTQLASH
jgi:hypothetical protein